MSKMLFVEVLRHDIDAPPAGETGWLAGMRNASISRMLALLHEKPPWTVECLTDDAAMSRSTLHERFAHFIGRQPTQYVCAVAYAVAARILRDTEAKLIELAWGARVRSRFARVPSAPWASPRVRGGPAVGPAVAPARLRRDPIDCAPFRRIS
jgi:transcriptional regulator GlxA family with amidase domain